VDAQESTVRNFGADYIALRGDGDITLHFDGETEARLADVAAYSGDWMWWSNRADDSNSRLTRAFDFTEVEPGDPIEMEIRMWFDIETDYDYGYVVVSRDGEKWTILPGRQTTTENPSGNSFGHAYTDRSQGAGGAPVWITERFDCPLFMSQVEYLQSVYHQNRGTEERRNAQRLFFRRHGMDEDLTEKLLGRGQDYLKRVSVLPPSYHRLTHGDEVVIGTRRFKVITGGGHALDQVMLYCAADKLFLSADQVLSKISPNVSVWAVEPEQNSLGEYLASLASLTTTLPYDVLVLPGHGVPFYGLKTRIKQLADHHEERCRLIAEACREVPQTSKQLVPVVFHKHVLDEHQMGFAAGELVAHVNYMLVEGRLTAQMHDDGMLRFKTT
jgi:glyoxylase-like metal-dependent hydrolase (beta-lactamase superfamily II)